MQLSSELFDRIIGPTPSGASETVAPSPVLDEAGEPAPIARPSIIMPAGARVVERRQVRRTRFGQRARTCLEQELSVGLWDTVMLQDISVAGLSFLSESWLNVNSAVHVTVEDRTGIPIRLRCVVRRCERGGIGGVWFTVGLTFDALLTPIPGGMEAEPVGASTQTEGVGAAARAVASDGGGGLLGRFSPARLLAAFTRNYDDYSTVSIGRSTGPTRR